MVHRMRARTREGLREADTKSRIEAEAGLGNRKERNHRDGICIAVAISGVGILKNKFPTLAAKEPMWGV